MSLLEFASGPALNLAIGVFVIGVVWRLGFLLRMKKRVDKSEPRGGNERFGGLWMIASRSINHGPLTVSIKPPIANAYLMHLVLAITIFAATSAPVLLALRKRIHSVRLRWEYAGTTDLVA